MKFLHFLVLACIGLHGVETVDTCHYSCMTCMHQFHQFCKTCQQGYDLVVVKNPSQIPDALRNSRTPTGMCLKESQSAPSQSPNILGIIILISCLLLIPISKSPLSFYIASSLQSLSLIRFLQISWINPSGYILNAFQYLSPCNIFTHDIKQNSWQFKLYSFSYLGEIFVQPDLQKSLIFVGVLDVAVFLGVVGLYGFRVLRRKYCADCCRDCVCISEWAIQHQLSYLTSLYYFLIQQTILCFVISLQFQEPTPFLISTLLIYCITTLLLCIYIYRIRIQLFPNRLVQFYSLCKKIIYPIFIVVPFKFQYLLLILMSINCFIQAIFDYKIKTYQFKSLDTVYKALQFATILFLGVFYAVDGRVKNQMAVFGVGVGVGVLLAANLLLFYMEVVRKLYQNYHKSIEQNQNKKIEVPEVSMLGRQPTFGLISTKREKQDNTETDLIDQKAKENNLHLNENMDEPPKFQRSDTKDSKQDWKELKQKKEEKESSGLTSKKRSHEIIVVEQIAEEKAEKEEDKEEPNLALKAHPKRRKMNENLRSDLRKRYGL